MAIIQLSDLITNTADVSDNGKKQQAIDHAIALVERYCGRSFESATYKKWVYLDGCPHCLDDYPVTSLVVRSPVCALQLSLSSSTTYYASAEVTATTLKLTASGSTTTLTLATYTTMALLAAAITGVWSASVDNDGDPTELKPCILGYGAAGGTGQLESAGDVVTSVCDYNTGIVTLGQNVRGWHYFSYTAGYSIVPTAIKAITVKLAGDLLQTPEHDLTTLVSPVGGREYILQNQMRNTLLAPYKADLDMYRKKII